MLLREPTLIISMTGSPCPSKLTVIKSEYRQFYTHHTMKLASAATSPSHLTAINYEQQREVTGGMDADPP